MILEKSKKILLWSLIALIPFFILLTWYFIDHSSLQHIDNLVTLRTYGLRTPWLNSLFKTITLLGNPPTITALTVILSIIAYLAQRNISLSLWIILANVIGSLGINPFVKDVVARQRPAEDMRIIKEMSYSFPSGHAFASVVLYGGLIVIVLLSLKKGPWRNVFVSLISIGIVLVGMSRIYLGVHYLSDVLAGFSLGLAWLLLSYIIVRPRQLDSVEA